MILHTCSRTHTFAEQTEPFTERSTQRSLSCRLRRILPTELYPLRSSPAPAVSATRCEQYARVHVT